MTTNSEGRLHYAKLPARHRVRRSKKPDALATAVLIFTALPILAVLCFAVSYLHSFIMGAGITGAQSVMYLPYVAATLGAVMTCVLMKRARTNRMAWAMSLCTVALLLAAAFPLTYSITKAITEESCEDAPGGRGYAGTSAPEEALAVCDWARTD
ncbi:hypothetical protein [Arthrobacter sp. H5]|uniref:hypothetical protein n=1 Tax=Arthrobacter sp. H5 TaxID=1267973 RepID=UPI00048644FE|nr:hypothetical protein [Arthrobacter sp. H5]